MEGQRLGYPEQHGSVSWAVRETKPGASIHRAIEVTRCARDPVIGCQDRLRSRVEQLLAEQHRLRQGDVRHGDGIGDSERFGGNNRERSIKNVIDKDT